MSFAASINVKYESAIVALLKRKAQTREEHEDYFNLFIPATPAGFTLSFSVGKKMKYLHANIFISSHDWNNRAKMFRSAAKWITSAFPKAKIIGASWSDTAGGARYVYEEGKFLMFQCGDFATPWWNNIDGVVPGAWLHDSVTSRTLLSRFGKKNLQARLGDKPFFTDSALLSEAGGGTYFAEKCTQMTTYGGFDLRKVVKEMLVYAKEKIFMDKSGKVLIVVEL